jgi:hypothetical protein
MIDRDAASLAVELYRSGLSAAQVAVRVGCGARTVLDYVRRAGVPRRPVGWATYHARRRAQEPQS